MTNDDGPPPTYAGEAGEALSDEREECGHDNCPRVNTLAEARFWIRVLNRRSVRDSEHYVELLERLARLERPWWKRMWS